jgi:hypothetical protein
MVLEIDSLGVTGKRTMVVGCTIVGLVFSNVSFALRIWVKTHYQGSLFAEDWLMGVALFISYSFVFCEFYGKLFYPTNSRTCNNLFQRSRAWIGTASN